MYACINLLNEQEFGLKTGYSTEYALIKVVEKLIVLFDQIFIITIWNCKPQYPFEKTVLLKDGHRKPEGVTQDLIQGPMICFDYVNNLDKIFRLLISIMFLDDTILFLPKEHESLVTSLKNHQKLLFGLIQVSSV